MGIEGTLLLAPPLLLPAAADTAAAAASASAAAAACWDASWECSRSDRAPCKKQQACSVFAHSARSVRRAKGSASSTVCLLLSIQQPWVGGLGLCASNGPADQLKVAMQGR